jgi:hypothetical protein
MQGYGCEPNENILSEDTGVDGRKILILTFDINWVDLARVRDKCRL